MTPFERADYARTLLASEVFRAAYNDLHAGAVSRLEQVPVGNVQDQQSAILALQAITALKSRLERYVQDGLSEEAKQKQDAAIEARRETLDTSRFGSIRNALGRFASRG